MPRIALLEKSPHNLELMIKTLIPAGFDVNDYAEVNTLLCALGTEYFDAALLDAAGIGADFADACSGLREHGVPFIVVVSRRGLVETDQALTQGSMGTLERPLTMRGLVNVLNTLSEFSKTWP